MDVVHVSCIDLSVIYTLTKIFHIQILHCITMCYYTITITIVALYNVKSEYETPEFSNLIVFEKTTPLWNDHILNLGPEDVTSKQDFTKI